MQCDECDTDLPADARFCHDCGADVIGRRSPRGRRPANKLRPTAPAAGGAPVGRTALADRNETALWSGSFSAKGLIHSWLLAILISLVLPVGGSFVEAGRTEWIVILCVIVVVWLGLGIILFIQKLNVYYELTDQRLIHRSGILLRRTNRIELIDMDDVSHEQGLIERFFDVGTIEISSSDRSHPHIELPGIDHVEQVAMLIDDARRRERIRRGIHIEQI